MSLSIAFEKPETFSGLLESLQREVSVFDAIETKERAKSLISACFTEFGSSYFAESTIIFTHIMHCLIHDMGLKHSLDISLLADVVTNSFGHSSPVTSDVIDLNLLAGQSRLLPSFSFLPIYSLVRLS
jgi:hypothetical protein